MCLIFEMRRVRLNDGNIRNIYKLVDIDFAMPFDLNNVYSLMPLNNSYTNELLYIICDHNKNMLGDRFNKEGLYAGYITQQKLEELLESYDYVVDDVIEYLFNEWGNCYKYLKKNFTISQVKIEENIILCDKTFGEKLSNKNIDGSTKITQGDKNILNKYGTFLTDKKYIYNPAIGREEEIKRLEMALLGFDTNALLVGDAGVGKTAVVEGLAYKIQNGTVHEKLKNIEIVSISSASMISGAKYVGVPEERVLEIVNVLKNNKNIVMFTDEIHTLEGAGAGSKSNIDVANILKPYIERGDVKIIGSTTVNEYDNVMSDDAFKSRLKRIDVKEPDNEMLKNILDGVIDGLSKLYNIGFDYDYKTKNNIYNILMELTSNKHRVYNDKSNNPRLILSIIKDMYSSALYNNNTSITTDDIIFGIKECDRLYNAGKERYILELEKLKLINNSEFKDSKILKFPSGNFN